MKNKLLILIGLIGFVFPLRANALSGNVTLTCDKLKVSAGNTINCSIKGNINEEVSSVHAEVNLGSNLTLVSANADDSWEGDGDGGVYDLYTDENKKGTFNIGTFSVKVGDSSDITDTHISLKNVVLSDASFNEQGFSVAKVDIRMVSTINTLSNLSIDGGNINFDENTTTYDMEIDSDSVKISASKKDSNSTITGDTGSKTLKYGKNTFKITVTSESGAKKVYTLNITRPDNRSKTNTLSSLKLSEGNIKFSSGTTTYNVTVEHKISSIKVEATVTDEKSSFVSGYGPRTVNLKVGTNTIEVKVKAENENVKTYKINVTRKSDPNDVRSSNNYLSELKLSEGILSFDKEELEYKVTVLYEVEKIEVTTKTEHDKATAKVEAPEKLEVGENTIVVKVTAENGSTREYKIIVERKAESEKLSDNNKLSSLTVSGYELNFNSNVYEYNLKINDEKILDISYVQEDESSEVVIKGNENLQNGSVITINVTSETGVTEVYKINIEKKVNTDLLMYIIIGGVVLLVLIVIIVISSKKKNNNQNNSSGNINNVNDLAIKQNVIPQSQNIQNMTYTGSPQQNTQVVQNNTNGVSQQNNNPNNNFF